MNERPYKINGWYVIVHPLFTRQIEELTNEVEKLKASHPDTYQKKKVTLRLAAIKHLILNDITIDPSNTKFRLGGTLGDDYKHWFRAKFYQQYRLFFRYESASKIIILVWVNDDNTLRIYKAKNDAYKVFKGMLDDGNPPDDWGKLLSVCKTAQMNDNLEKHSAMKTKIIKVC